MIEDRKENSDKDDEFISNFYDEIEREKEDRFVKFMIEIIVAMTLKELYGEDDDMAS